MSDDHHYHDEDFDRLFAMSDDEDNDDEDENNDKNDADRLKY